MAGSKHTRAYLIKNKIAAKKSKLFNKSSTMKLYMVELEVYYLIDAHIGIDKWKAENNIELLAPYNRNELLKSIGGGVNEEHVMVLESSDDELINHFSERQIILVTDRVGKLIFNDL